MIVPDYHLIVLDYHLIAPDDLAQFLAVSGASKLTVQKYQRKALDLANRSQQQQQVTTTTTGMMKVGSRDLSWDGHGLDAGPDHCCCGVGWQQWELMSRCRPHTPALPRVGLRRCSC